MDEFNGHDILFVEPLTDSQIGELAILSTPLENVVGPADFDFMFGSEVHHSSTEIEFQLGTIAYKEIFSNPYKSELILKPAAQSSYDIFNIDWGCMHKEVAEQLEVLSNPDRASMMQNFFKTGKGQYGEGDLFLGLTVPHVRIIAKQYYAETSIDDIDNLLQSPWHEVRLCAVVMLNYKFPKETLSNKEKIYNLYKSNVGKGINNWDIIDVSCPHIIGRWLYDKPRDDLYIMASGGLWHKRTSIISTFYFLRKGEITDTLMLAEVLVSETHDLIQKAVGWSLREIGKIDDSVLLSFLDKHARSMPRTMLRYSIEKLPTEKKLLYMNAKNQNTI